VKRSIFLRLTSRYPNRNIGDVIGDLPKEFEVIDHLSSRRAIACRIEGICRYKRGAAAK
jgi:hypothetical protein